MISVGAALAIASTAQAATVTQFAPVSNGANTILSYNVQNDDAGASYNSLVTDTSGLVDQLAALNSTTQADIISQIGVDIDDTEGIGSGWNESYNASGDVVVGNVGGIEGITYDAFLTGENMRINLTIPTALAPFGIAYGAVNPNFVRIENGSINTPDILGSAQNYVVVPEPSSLALLGITGLILMRRRSTHWRSLH